MELSTEEKKRIYEEEKIRIEAQEKVKKEVKEAKTKENNKITPPRLFYVNCYYHYNSISYRWI